MVHAAHIIRAAKPVRSRRREEGEGKRERERKKKKEKKKRNKTARRTAPFGPRA